MISRDILRTHVEFRVNELKNVAYSSRNVGLRIGSHRQHLKKYQVYPFRVMDMLEESYHMMILGIPTGASKE